MSDEIPLDRNTGSFSALLGFFKNALGALETRRVRVTDDGSLHVADGDPSEGEFRSAIAKAGASTAVVPDGTAMAAIVAGDILKWTYPSGKKRLTFMAGRDLLAGQTCLGWAITWGVGLTPTEAKDRLKVAVDTPSKYASGASVQTDTNSGTIWLPPDARLGVRLDETDALSVYAMALTSAGTQVGNQFLTGVVS